MSRPKKTEAEMQIRRSQILDTAYSILQEEGPQAITSRAIAARMGIAHMSLFTYFDNLAAILSALREREMSRWRDKVQLIGKHTQTEEVTQVVKDVLNHYITFAREFPNLYRLAWVMPELGGETQQQNRQRMQGTVEQLSRLLTEGMEQGSFTKREPFLAAATVLGMVNMPFILYHTGKLVDPELRDRMEEEVLTAVMCYLRD